MMVPGSLPGAITFLDRCLYLESADALVLADVHLGRGIHSAIDAPIDHADAPHDRLERAIERVDPSSVVVAGDLLHAFSTVPLAVARQLERFEEVVSAAGAALIVVEGNHDTVLQRVYDGTIHDEYHVPSANAVIAHGHEPPEQIDDLLIVGHGHPAMVVEGRKYPCFLYGKAQYSGTSVVVLPPFSRLARGVRVNGSRRDIETPVVSDLEDCRPGVVDPDDEDVLWFPTLRRCRRVS